MSVWRMGKMGFAPTVVLNCFMSPALELLLMKSVPHYPISKEEGCN